VILNLSNGERIRLHHTFNVRYKDTHIWRVNLTEALISKSNYTNVTFRITSYDPGADNLTLNLNFGDGTNITKFYPNNNRTFPVLINISLIHYYFFTGTFNVTLIANDNDGGITIVKIQFEVG
jgi:hypothetical protein